jgi:2-phosphosulfolactate phosphatase
MTIEILQLIEGARKATGLTVIIDVFRAFSTACYAFDRGAARIIPVGDLELAYELKKRNPELLLMGERKGRKQPGFDYGNSPAEIETADFTNRTIVQTTSAGTQGIAAARGAEQIVTGSFVNARAIVSYIKAAAVSGVSLVCMGSEARESSDEDTLCAEYIRDSLTGKTTDFEKIRARLRRYKSSAKFFDEKTTWAPERDFHLCLHLDRFSFVLVAKMSQDGLLYLQRVDVDSTVRQTDILP